MNTGLVFGEICISLAFEIREDDAGYLGWLYSGVNIHVAPKMHHLVHLLDQILRYNSNSSIAIINFIDLVL